MKMVEDTDLSGDLWKRIAESLGRGEPVALATIIDRSGSGPREAGTSMLVFGDGGALGTIGGGLLEVQVLDAAKGVHRDRLPLLQEFSMTAETVEAGVMICGGKMEVLIDYLDPADPLCVTVFKRLAELRREGRFVWLVRSIRGSGSGTVPKTGIGLLGEGLEAGTLDPSCRDSDRLRKESRRDEAVLVDCGDVRCFVQPAGLPSTVFIFGAGHIAQALAPICAIAGFRVVVIDDRPEYAARERFPMAAEVRAIDSFARCFEGLTINRSGYVVIVTYGHVHDRTVLAGALKTDAAYVGMISSRRKREIILASLRDEGVGDEVLRRVHSPIGLEIGGRTPGEIAVSIAAELVAVRAGKIP